MIRLALFVTPAKAGAQKRRWMPAPELLSKGAGMTMAALIAIFALVAFTNLACATEAVILSDIHFNPLADKALAEELAAAPVKQWATILDRGRERISIYGEDSDWKLVRTALAAMKQQAKPDFVLIPGDFVVHNFRDVFNASVAEHSNAAYRRFVAKTIRFLALQLEATFPQTPIMPALGNNDSDCGDYAVQPGGSFLADTRNSIADLIGTDADDGFAKSWDGLGNYAVTNPALPDETVIAVNTNFFSPHYRDSCGSAGAGNPAPATIAWLRRTLAATAAAHRKAILIYHIPPGADAYGTARKTSCPITPVPMLAEPYAGELHDLMLRYRDTIVADIAGHLHTDAFRILRDHDTPFGFVMIVPGISPIFGQNPSFRRAHFAADGTIADTTVFYLANLLQVAAGGRPQWQPEASFDHAWSVPRYDAASLDTLFRRIGTEPELHDRWTESYGVQGPAGAAITPETFATYRCSVGSDRVGDVARCLCGGTP